MHVLVPAILVYLAIGAVLFAHPVGRALPDDFHWKNQIDVFRTSLPEVLCWPIALWRFGRTYFGRD